MERKGHTHPPRVWPNRADSAENRPPTGTRTFPFVPNAPEPNDSTNSLAPRNHRRCPFGARYRFAEPSWSFACFNVQYRARNDRAIAGNRTRLTRISSDPTVVPMEAPVG